MRQQGHLRWFRTAGAGALLLPFTDVRVPDPYTLMYSPRLAREQTKTAETLTRARTLRVRARLPYPIGPPNVFAMAVSVLARAA